ncbi:MAG: hypothetical protein VYA51_04330 [Planctomycetota bacterium]|nr:hypothetical protein [Planctomycetota bacterium]
MNSIIRNFAVAASLVVPVLGQALDSTVKKPSPAVQKARRALPADQATQTPTTGLKASGGNTWFPVTVRELGTFYGSGEAIGKFDFTNPQQTDVDWVSLSPSCQCARAEVLVGDGESLRIYRVISKPQKRLVRVTRAAGEPERLENVSKITIGPGESGTITTRLDMNKITGGKHATLDIHGTDPVDPHTKLTFRATGAQLFTVSPKEINLNKMTWNETREFSVIASSQMAKEWEILSVDKPSDAFQVSWEKVSNNGFTSYRISGTYGPVSSEVAGGGMLKFRTNLRGGATFNVRVLAFVQGPLDVKPGGFLTLGLIRKGKTVTKSVTFTPNDGTDLRATELSFEKMTLKPGFVTASQRKDGDKLVVELSVADNAPKGLVKGELVIKLNHPLIKEKRVMFNGFVR